MSEGPLITVVTVSYNAVSVIEQTILSVINQSYSAIEYIIIDGGSMDGTVDIIKKYNDRISYWVSEPDKGIYDAMNKGLQKANGQYCNFMNAGDSFYTLDCLEFVFKSKQDADVIYGDNVLDYVWGRIVLAPDMLSNMERYMTFGHQSSFTKTSVLKVYGFDCLFKIAADYNLFYTLFKNKYVFEYIEKSISLFDASNGVSNNYPLITFREDAMITKRIDKPFWTLSFQVFKIIFLLKSTLRKCLPASYVEKKSRKRICMNPLIKVILLK